MNTMSAFDRATRPPAIYLRDSWRRRVVRVAVVTVVGALFHNQLNDLRSRLTWWRFIWAWLLPAWGIRLLFDQGKSDTPIQPEEPTLEANRGCS